MPTLKELAFTKENLLKCTGYSANFIDKKKEISLDKILSPAARKLLPKVEGNKTGVLNYCDFSVLYNSKRKVPFLVAYNIDGNDKADQAPRPLFQSDPRIIKEIQLDKTFYSLTKDKIEFEIGHMASNNEMGRGINGKVKAYQTFHFVNSAPQALRLNTGMWRGLESYIIKEAGTVKTNKRINVFTGPLLLDTDPAYLKKPSFKMPLLFFKVIVFMNSGKLYSTAFVISHEKKLIEDNVIKAPSKKTITRGISEQMNFTDYPFKKVFQVNIPFLEKNTGLNFSWPGVKSIVVPEEKKLIEKIKSIGNAQEAKEAIKKRGLTFKPVTTTADVSATELKSQNYLLNIVLP